MTQKLSCASRFPETRGGQQPYRTAKRSFASLFGCGLMCRERRTRAQRLLRNSALWLLRALRLGPQSQSKSAKGVLRNYVRPKPSRLGGARRTVHLICRAVKCIQSVASASNAKRYAPQYQIVLRRFAVCCSVVNYTPADLSEKANSKYRSYGSALAGCLQK